MRNIFQNTYNSDQKFLKAKVMITEGFCKTISFEVILEEKLELRFDPISGRITRHLCLFVFSFLKKPRMNREFCWLFYSHVKRGDLFLKCNFCFITKESKICKAVCLSPQHVLLNPLNQSAVSLMNIVHMKFSEFYLSFHNSC